MIYGIGTDVVSIERIARALDRFGARFANRILTPDERPRYERTRAKASHLAKRFAAKEAFAKAIGTGIRAPFRWHSITVGRDARGKPVLAPNSDMARFLAGRGVTASHVSLTDDAGVAVAFVVLESSPSPLGARPSSQPSPKGEGEFAPSPMGERPSSQPSPKGEGEFAPSPLGEGRGEG